MFNIPFEELISPSALAFYEDNKHVPLTKLLLKFAKDSTKKALSLQLESRRRAEGKLDFWLKTNGIVFPPKLNLEQASSEITAAFKANIVEYETSLDLTAGTGIDSWQFATHAKKHTLVESNADLIALTKYNFEKLGIKNTLFFAQSAEDYLAQNQQFFDLIYIDPSRRNEDGSRAIALEDYSPNVIEMQDKLLKSCRHLLVKVSPFADIAYLISCFPKHLKEINIVAVGNECKEILLLLSPTETENPQIKTVNISSSKTEKFAFELSTETNKAELANEVEEYIFEPNAAVLKSGAFNTIACSFHLKKLAINSHLYTGNALLPNFSGKTYRVEEVAAAYKLKGKYKNVSIATRNFPDKPETIRKRLKISDGNDFKLFATTIAKSKVFIVGIVVDDNLNTVQDK